MDTALFFPYVIVGSLINWNYATLVVCNIFFMALAHYIYFKLRKTAKVQMMWIAGMESSVLWVTRYSLSAMLEPSVMALCLIWIGLVRSKERYAKKDFFWIYMVTFLLSIIRPYFGVLFFLPVVKKGLGKKLLISAGMSTLAVLMYVAGKNLLCAEYVRAEGCFNIKESFLLGCVDFLERMTGRRNRKYKIAVSVYKYVR